MMSDERFVFTLDASGAAVVDPLPINGPSKTHAHTESLAAAQLLQKWGLSLSPDERRGGLLQRFNYRIVKDAQLPSDNGTVGSAPLPTVPASSLRFHDGLVPDFLSALFTDKTVQAALKAANPKVRLPADQAATGLVQFEKLRCRWTDLSPFDAPLLDGKVVRKVTNDLGAEDSGTTARAAKDAPPMPVVKRMEELLPGGVVIADEIRALFLQAHSRRRQWTGGHHGDDCDGNIAESQTDKNGAAQSEEEDDDDEMNFDDYGGGAKLSKKDLRLVFSESDRQELLYHIVWRLVAGGGAMNQFEDDFQVYKSAARDLYRALVTSIAVKPVTVESSKGTMDQIDDGEPTEKAIHYVPEVTALALRVTGLKRMTKTQPLALFPCSDDRTPSNLNYCYVVVNPLQQTAVLWYHGCSETYN